MAYVTLAEIKAYLSITDTSRDTILQRAVDAASASIDRACGRTFALDVAASARVVRTRGKLYRDGGDYVLIVPDIATATGLVIADRTVTTDLGQDGLPVITRLYSAAAWPETSVSITAQWGWPEVPDEIGQATLLFASKLFKRKDSPEGVLASSDWGAVRVTRRDPDVQNLIDPYVLMGIA
jgi:hypothetical protein